MLLTLELFLLDHDIETLAFKILHRDRGDAVFHQEVMNSDDVGMTDFSRVLELSQKTLARLAITGQLRVHKLEDHLFANRFVLNQHNPTHGTTPNLLIDAVAIHPVITFLELFNMLEIHHLGLFIIGADDLRRLDSGLLDAIPILFNLIFCGKMAAFKYQFFLSLQKHNLR